MNEQLSDLEILALAGIVRLDEEAYGVSIRDEIRRCTGRSVSIGSLYKALHRLEERGMVSTEVGEPTAVRGGRSKKLVRVTLDGLAALEASVTGYQRLFDGLDLEAP